jgi:predicted enzyme related to lactoylglutathione lyase
MVGVRGAPWHLELLGDHEAHAQTPPGPEDLLVLYFGAVVAPALVERLLRNGGTRVDSPKPYLQRWAITFADPDGYRLVLCQKLGVRSCAGNSASVR